MTPRSHRQPQRCPTALPTPSPSARPFGRSRHRRLSRATAATLTAGLLLSLLQGCSPPSWMSSRFPAVAARMQVTKLNTPGRYQIAGEAQLPAKTKMGVAALRPLSLTQPVADNPAGRRTYALLDYEVTEVVNGAWQVDLDLWQVASDGQFQENWQGYSDRLDWSVAPDEEVIFLTIPTPTADLAQLEQRLRKRQQQLDEALRRRTFEGRQYAELAYVDAVPLPTGRTAERQRRPQDINGGWGRRYLLQPESANPNTLEQPRDRRTTAPPTPEEFLR